MLEARGRVVAIEDGMAWVESPRQSACGSCASKGHCGTGLLGDALMGGKVSRMAVRDTLGVRVGDEVILGLPEEGVVRASLLLYGLPLAGFVGGMALFQPAGEGWSLLAGGLGLVGGLLLLGPLGRRAAGRQAEPRILARIQGPVVARCDVHP